MPLTFKQVHSTATVITNKRGTDAGRNVIWQPSLHWSCRSHGYHVQYFSRRPRNILHGYTGKATENANARIVLPASLYTLHYFHHANSQQLYQSTIIFK